MKSKQSIQKDKQSHAYRVTINTTSFQYKKPSLKQKTQREYLPQYWQKFNMDQKTILPSKQDRLSQLTTKQIDRIIDMQKIRSLLYDKKRKVEDKYFQYDNANPNTHSNIYQANFLAKINQIAIKRNVKQESLEGFDQFHEDNPRKTKERQKRILTVPYKYTKNYSAKNGTSEKRAKTMRTQDDDEKSIASIEGDLDNFQIKLQQKKLAGNIRYDKRRSHKNEYKLLPSKRWFYGMSTFYFDKDNSESKLQGETIYRGNFDIQSEKKEGNRQIGSIRQRKSNYSTMYSKNKDLKRNIEPFDQFKISRLITIE